MTRGTRGSHSCNMWPIFASRLYSIECGTQLLSVLKNQCSVLKINDTVFVGKQFSSKRYFGHQILPQIPEISSNSTKSRGVFELDSFFCIFWQLLESFCYECLCIWHMNIFVRHHSVCFLCSNTNIGNEGKRQNVDFPQIRFGFCGYSEKLWYLQYKIFILSNDSLCFMCLCVFI